jgi:hypothetical protein
MPTQYSCVAGCSKTYEKSSSLAHHKNRCSFALELRKKSQEIRAQKGDNGFPEHMNISERTQRFVVSFQFEGSKGVEKEKKFPTVPAETSSTSDIAISSATSNLVPDFIQPEPEPIPSPVPPSALALTVSGRPHRQRKLPQKLRDLLPEPPAPASPPSVPDAKPVRRVLLIDLSNAHGCSMNPNPLPNLSNQSAPPVDSDRPFHWPFSNPTIWRVMSWLNNGKTAKSEAEVTDFIHNAVLSRDFNKDDLKGFNAHRENQRLDKTLSKASLQAHFSESSVDILVPSGNTAIPPKIFTIPGLLHRKLTSVICDAFQDPLAHLLHYSPFKLFHRNPVTKEEERLYGELYTSDAFHDEHENLQRHGKLPLDDLDCKREKVIAALMVSSDATHLTDFGNAKAWPIYLMLGNLSKYLRSLPNSGAIHHLAYIPSLPDSFQDFASIFHCKWRSQKQDIMTHCRRELMQAVWDKILDEDFIHAYLYGIVIKCIDGIERRVYPRFFTYSADYPEKVLLATIRNKGSCPCPRCLVTKSKLDGLGTYRDNLARLNKFRECMADKVAAARRAVYDLAKSIRSTVVEDLLKGFSGVPTTNAFVNRLGSDFNPSRMLVVDLLHVFELGVWKALFTHLIRLLHAAGRGSDNLVLELDRRYRQISTFGHGTIRNFSANSSEMKKLAARDFEDLLQVKDTF